MYNIGYVGGGAYEPQNNFIGNGKNPGSDILKRNYELSVTGFDI